MSKILVLDIETSPNQSYTWGLWNQNVSLNQLIEASTVLCWSAKWLGDKKVHFSGMYDSNHRNMCKKIHKLLDEADAVITYNGDKFDLPTLNREFLRHRLTPPSPYKSIDLYKTVKSKFKFVSNKLDHVASELGIGQKVKHDGMPLWLECMAKKPQAWKTMKKYNCQDVKLTEEVYERMIGWVKSPFNHNSYKTHDGIVCPNCGSNHMQKRGTAVTTSRKYQRYQCLECGKWSKSNKSIKELTKREFVQPL